MDINDSFRLNEINQVIDSAIILTTEISPSLNLMMPVNDSSWLNKVGSTKFKNSKSILSRLKEKKLSSDIVR